MQVTEESSDPAGYIGKLVLVGITRVNALGVTVAQIQYHGRISSITEDGICIDTADGKQMVLPPAVEALQSAPPGEYREQSSGATIVDPDLISTWEIREPAEGGDPAWSFTLIAFPAANVKPASNVADRKRDDV